MLCLSQTKNVSFGSPSIVKACENVAEAIKKYIVRDHDKRILYFNKKNESQLQSLFTLVGAVGGVVTGFDAGVIPLSMFAAGTGLSVGLRGVNNIISKMEEYATGTELKTDYKSVNNKNTSWPNFSNGEESDKEYMNNFNLSISRAKHHIMPFANAAERDEKLQKAIRYMETSKDYMGAFSFLANMDGDSDYRKAFINANDRMGRALPYINQSIEFISRIEDPSLKTRCVEDLLVFVRDVDMKVGSIPFIKEGEPVTHPISGVLKHISLKANRMSKNTRIREELPSMPPMRARSDIAMGA